MRGPERRLGAGGVALLALLGSGCVLFHRAPPLPPVIIPQPPLIFPAPPPAPMMAPAELTPVTAPAPVWAAVTVPPPPPVERARRAPAPVRVDRPAPPPQAPPPPLNAGLSPREQFAYRGQTRALLQRAQHDLELLARRALSPSAAATRAQAGEYVRQAQEAMAQGDLVRAQTLAGKAETLARFLLGQ